MSNEIHSTEFHGLPADAAPQSMHLEPEKACSLLRLWLNRAAVALERAERRITENFQVPPNGG